MCPGPGAQRARVRTVGDLLGLVEDLEDPLAGCDGPLRLTDPHSEHPQRHGEHREQEVEREERAERERPGDHHPPRREQHERLRDERHEREQRHVESALPVGRKSLLEDLVRCGREARGAPFLLGERLDDVHAGDGLLRDDRDARERLLDVAEHRMRDMAIPKRCQRDEGRDGERDERELPAVEEQHHGDDEHRRDVLGEEDEPVAEEEAHGLQVDRRPRHQLAGLAAVVEAEGKP